jgi:hypothetical protein
MDTIFETLRMKATTVSMHLRIYLCALKIPTTFGVNHAPILRHDKHYLRTDQNELPFDPRYLGGPSGVPKNISLPVVNSAQTMHQSCAEINTVSKQIETSFHLTHIT